MSALGVDIIFFTLIPPLAGLTGISPLWGISHRLGLTPCEPSWWVQGTVSPPWVTLQGAVQRHGQTFFYVRVQRTEAPYSLPSRQRYPP